MTNDLTQNNFRDFPTTNLHDKNNKSRRLRELFSALLVTVINLFVTAAIVIEKGLELYHESVRRRRWNSWNQDKKPFSDLYLQTFYISIYYIIFWIFPWYQYIKGIHYRRSKCLLYWLCNFALHSLILGVYILARPHLQFLKIVFSGLFISLLVIITALVIAVTWSVYRFVLRVENSEKTVVDDVETGGETNRDATEDMSDSERNREIEDITMHEINAEQRLVVNIPEEDNDPSESTFMADNTNAALEEPPPRYVEVEQDDLPSYSDLAFGQ